jgi:Rrf2 family protein
VKFSRGSQYGLCALLFLARQPTRTVLPLTAIAEATALPPSFLAKICQKLAHDGVLRSFRSAVRGYALARPAHQIRLREILEVIDGPGRLERCIFWSDRCDAEHPCPLHAGWQRTKPRFVRFLNRTTLAELK